MGLFDKAKGLKTYSKIENGVLIKMDERDIKENKAYILPDDVVQIKADAFLNKKHQPVDKMEALYLGCAVESIPNFWGFKNLRGVYMMNAAKIKEIPEETFKNCAMLSSVVLPSKVVEIGSGAFEGCERLTFLGGKDNNQMSLPESLEVIGNNAFKGCKQFSTVTIPKNVSYIGDGAFDCENLNTVEFEGLMPNYAVDPFGESVRTVIYRGYKINLPLNYFPTTNGKKMLRGGQVMEVAPFVDYAVANNKPLPKLETIIRDTRPAEIKDFYEHAEDFTRLAGEYLTTWSKDIELSRASDEDILSAYHKACIALGVFSPEQKDRTRAQGFLTEKIAKMSPDALVKEFTYFNTFINGYNKDFANYYMKGFEESIDIKGNKNYGIAGSNSSSWALYMRGNGTNQFLENLLENLDESL